MCPKEADEMAKSEQSELSLHYFGQFYLFQYLERSSLSVAENTLEPDRQSSGRSFNPPRLQF